MIDALLGYMDDSILSKAMRYCAYRERCQKEVRQKLFELKCNPAEAETIIAYLVRENFINEQRFAAQYACGKFRINKWGKIKIKLMLEQFDISPYNIRNALNQINMTDYQQAIVRQIKLNEAKSTEPDRIRRNNRISKAIISKGFEPELVWDLLRAR